MRNPSVAVRHRLRRRKNSTPGKPHLVPYQPMGEPTPVQMSAIKAAVDRMCCKPH